MLNPARTLLRTPWLTVTICKPQPGAVCFNASRSLVFVLWGEYSETSLQFLNPRAKNVGMRLVRLIGFRRLRRYYRVRMIQRNTILLVVTGRKHHV